MKTEKIFFQSSMPRALSTTFQNLMLQNPDFYCTPTDGALELIFGARANFSQSPEFKAQNHELMKRAFLNFCKEGLQGYCDALIENTSAKYVLLKSRGWGVYRPFVENFMEKPKVICLVRNLKDVVASYEKIYRKTQYLHDPIRNDLDGRGTTLDKRVMDWMNPQNTIGRAVERIFEMMRQGYDNEIHFVKAEDLCLYPETTMTQVYQYLELPYFKHDFDNIEQKTQEDDAVYGLTPDLHTIRTKLEMKPSDADKVLGKDVTNWLHTNFKWYYDKFRYQK
jgi:sulfotransferase